MPYDKITVMCADRVYKSPSLFEKAFNRVFGFVAGAGIGPAFIYRLEVRGRKSGKIHSTAVNVMDLDGKKYMVSPRGRTQWVRNAEAAGEVTLKRGKARKFRLRALEDTEKPKVLKTYLTNYKSAVQQFFPIRPDAEVGAFAEISAGYPAFELTEM